MRPRKPHQPILQNNSPRGLPVATLTPAGQRLAISCPSDRVYFAGVTFESGPALPLVSLSTAGPPQPHCGVVTWPLQAATGPMFGNPF